MNKIHRHGWKPDLPDIRDLKFYISNSDLASDFWVIQSVK